jgi:hypothetical protein
VEVGRRTDDVAVPGRGRHSVTLYPPPAIERGGTSRPSRSTTRAVVVARDPAIGDGWDEPVLSYVISPPA